MRIDHTNCSHERTPKARAACRKANPADQHGVRRGCDYCGGSRRADGGYDHMTPACPAVPRQRNARIAERGHVATQMIEADLRAWERSHANGRHEDANGYVRSVHGDRTKCPFCKKS